MEEEREAEEAREQRARLRRVSRRRADGGGREQSRGEGHGQGQSTAGAKRREPTLGQRAAPSRIGEREEDMRRWALNGEASRAERRRAPM